MRTFKKILLMVILSFPYQTMAAEDIQITNEWQVYSPSVLWQNGQIAMYYGGWGSEQKAVFPNPWPRDVIYRVTCTDATHCGNKVKVLDAADFGFRDTSGNTISHLNDPTVIQMPGGYYIMYVTGLEKPWSARAPIAGVEANDNHIYFTTSWDGITWGQPIKLLQDYWLPSVTVATKDIASSRIQRGDILLYANSNITGLVTAINMGPSGVGARWEKPISATFRSAKDNVYDNMNVTVKWMPSINKFQMLTGGVSYHESDDGINFKRGTLTTPASNAGHPSNWPDSFCWFYYGKQTGDSANIFFHRSC